MLSGAIIIILNWSLFLAQHIIQMDYCNSPQYMWVDECTPFTAKNIDEVFLVVAYYSFTSHSFVAPGELQKLDHSNERAKCVAESTRVYGIRRERAAFHLPCTAFNQVNHVTQIRFRTTLSLAYSLARWLAAPITTVYSISTCRLFGIIMVYGLCRRVLGRRQRLLLVCRVLAGRPTKVTHTRRRSGMSSVDWPQLVVSLNSVRSIDRPINIRWHYCLVEDTFDDKSQIFFIE